MDVEDCYSELGLEAGCSDAQVKAAWRRLAARWHPDRNDSPQAMRKMQRINRALEEIQRARAQVSQDASPPEAASDPPPAPAAGSAAHVVHHTLTVTLEEALAGISRWVQGEVEGVCAACEGAGTRRQVCGTCEGSGRVRQPVWFGWAAAQAACAQCDGTGEVSCTCTDCAGTGQQRLGRYRCRVHIPPGSRAGELAPLVVRAKGPDAFDIELRPQLAIEAHGLFTLADDGTIRCELPVDGFAWIAERWIDVPTPDGLQQMRLRRGATAYRIRHQGFPRDGGERADLIVTIEPLFPESLSPAQEAGIDGLMATNTGSAKTAAGKRMAQFKATVDAWSG